VESFVLLDPHLAVTRAAVPYWSTFAVDPSAQELERYLDAAEPYDEILLTLFSHGTEGVGVTPIERWRALLGRARRHGAFLGVDESRFPVTSPASGASTGSCAPWPRRCRRSPSPSSTRSSQSGPGAR
jgi:hypothetical protein